MIFLMLMSSIVFSILSDAVDNQLEFFVRREAYLIFKAVGVGVMFSDYAGD